MSKHYVEVRTNRDPEHIVIAPSEMTPGYYAVFDRGLDKNLYYIGFVNVYDLADFITW